jgi:hypothetical protein
MPAFPDYPIYERFEDFDNHQKTFIIKAGF